MDITIIEVKYAIANMLKYNSSSLTDDREVDVGVAGLSQTEINATTIQCLIFGFDVGQDKSSWMAISPKGGPLAENFSAGPLFGHTEIRVSRVDTTNKNKNLIKSFNVFLFILNPAKSIVTHKHIRRKGLISILKNLIYIF